MSNLRLTDIQQITGVTPQDLIHVVNTGDTSQFSGGSSYKASISQVYGALSGFVQTDDVYVTGSTLSVATNNSNIQQSNLLYHGTPIGGPYTIDTENTFITGFTYSDNTFTIFDNSGNTFDTTINDVTGLTINGDLIVTGNTTLDGLTANTISATTYENLPLDVYVTGGTYTNGEITFENNSGGTFVVTGLPIGGAGGQIYYFNLSNTQSPYQEFSPIATNVSEQTISVSVNSGTTSTIGSFQTPTGYPNTALIPAGYWSFYLHSYKDNIIASFDIFCEVYLRTTGGTETLLLTTDPTPVTSNSPNPSMLLTDGYYSGSSIDTSDRIVVKVMATNSGNQTNTITFVTEGTQHYSYGITPFSNNGTLTCDNLSGCSIIQTIQNDISNKFDKSGGTISGNVLIQNGLTATTISATTYQNLPQDIYVTGGTYSGGTLTLGRSSGSSVTVTGLTVGYTYTQTNNYTAGVPISITHNLGTTEVLVQIIDTNTNQLILGSVSNYQLNSIDVTLSTSLNGIKVVVAGGYLSSVTPKGKINLLFGHDSTSPADSTTYYIGGQFNLAAVTSASDGRRLISPVTGFITQVANSVIVGGVLGTNETSTFTINNITQSTSSTITTTATYDSSSSLINYNLSSPLQVNNGDKLEIRWSTPAWATNPTTIRQQLNVLIDF